MRVLLAVAVVLVLLAPVVHAQGPIIVGPNGQYLGNLSANPYDPNSVSNPYGRFGSRYSPDSINNPYGRGARRTAPTR
jgi:hypothetical protein